MGRYIILNTAILRETREKGGHIQESLAQVIGIARESYSRIELTGNTQVATAEKIAAELKVDLDHLTGTKRGDAMFSPFACEFLHPVEGGSKSTRRLFDTEHQLLELIETHIKSERPMLHDDMFPEFSKHRVPAYSTSADGRSVELKLPLRGREKSSSDGFHRFVFRELEYRESQGYVWRNLTKWAQITIEDRMHEILSRYWPEYRFNGKRHGEDADFVVSFGDGIDGNSIQSIRLKNFYMLIQFSHWLSRSLPKSSVSVIEGVCEIHLILLARGVGLNKIVISRMDRGSEKLAPFPEQWRKNVLMQLRVIENQDIGRSENKNMPSIEDFSELVPEIEAYGDGVRKRRLQVD
jgi:transcriptional regulator with XRE-family HTH domain